jgi:hypothetical protein
MAIGDGFSWTHPFFFANGLLGIAVLLFGSIDPLQLAPQGGQGTVL